MHETIAEQKLELERRFIALAKSAFDSGDLYGTAQLFAQAQRCKDSVYGILLGADPGLTTLTSKIMEEVKKLRRHPIAIQARREYEQGVNYCENKQRNILN